MHTNNRLHKLLIMSMWDPDGDWLVTVTAACRDKSLWIICESDSDDAFNVLIGHNAILMMLSPPSRGPNNNLSQQIFQKCVWITCNVVSECVLKVVFTTTIRSAAQGRLLRLSSSLRTPWNPPASPENSLEPRVHVYTFMLQFSFLHLISWGSSSKHWASQWVRNDIKS